MNVKERIEYIQALGRNVDRGVELLDAEVPEWYNLINIDSLNMASTKSCICGQAFMTRALESLNEVGKHFEDGYCYAMTELFADGTMYGFDTDPEFSVPDTAQYEDLAMLWIERIQKRQADEYFAPIYREVDEFFERAIK